MSDPVPKTTGRIFAVYWQRAETMPNDVQCAWVRDLECTEAIAERVRFNRSGWAVKGTRREIYPVQWAPRLVGNGGK